MCKALYELLSKTKFSSLGKNYYKIGLSAFLSPHFGEINELNT